MNTDLKLMKAAHDAELIKVSFEIHMNDKTFPVHFTSGDRFEMAEIQDEIQTEHRIKYKQKGWDKEPIDEALFRRSLENAKDEKTRERLLEQKPENLAEQKAQTFAMIKTVKELIPRYLKKENGELLCKTEEERAVLSQMISESRKLFDLLTEKYFEMINKESEIEEAVKN